MIISEYDEVRKIKDQAGNELMEGGERSKSSYSGRPARVAAGQCDSLYGRSSCNRTSVSYGMREMIVGH